MAETKPVLYACAGWLYLVLPQSGRVKCIHDTLTGDASCQACLAEIIAASKDPGPSEPRWVKVVYKGGTYGQTEDVWQPIVANDVTRIEVEHIGAMYVRVTVGEYVRLTKDMQSILRIESNLPIVSKGHV